MSFWEDAITTFKAYKRGLFTQKVWHIHNNLYQSGVLTSKVAPLILKLNDIEGIVDLEGLRDPHDVVKEVDYYRHFPIGDGPLPWNYPKFNEEAWDKWWALMEEANKISLAGINVLVHCGAGRNRASLGTGCIMWLRGLRGDAIVEYIRKKRPKALSNRDFEQYLREKK